MRKTKRLIKTFAVIVLVISNLLAGFPVDLVLGSLERVMSERKIVDVMYWTMKNKKVVDSFVAGGLPRVVNEANAAITFQSQSALAGTNSTGTVIYPHFPPSVAAGDLLVLIIGMKPSSANSGSVTTPSGWTVISGGSITGAGGYSTTLGADTGNTNIFSFYKIADGAEYDSLFSVALSTNNNSFAQTFRLSGTLGGWDLAAATGSDITGDASVSVTMDSDPGVTANDYVIGAFRGPTDATSAFSLHALTQTGITFGTVTERGDTETTIGNDGFITTWSAPVSSGTSSAAPVYTSTAGGTVTNARGPGIFIRIREVAAPGAPTLSPDDGGSNQIAFNNTRQNDTTPIVRASATASGTFDRFQVEFNTQADFTGTAYTETFSSTYSSATAYNLQTTASLSLPTTDGVTYYVRVRASADSGSHWGPWSGATWTYTYKSSGNPEWHQTVDEQFDTGTHTAVKTSGSDSMQLSTGIPEIKSWTRNARPNTGTPITLAKPSGVQTGDLLLILLGNDTAASTDQWNNTTTVPSGFTFMNTAGNTTSDAHSGAYYRIADGTEAATITAPSVSSSDYFGYYVRVVGVDTTTPINVVGADTIVGSATSLALTEVTTGVNNTRVFYIFGYDGGDAMPMGVTGTGWSETDEINVNAYNTTTNAGAVSGAWGTKEQATAGATGAATVTTGLADGIAGFQFAVAPRNPSSGTVMSPEIDYDWGQGATTWGEASFATTETNGDVKVSLYYTNATTCDTIVPNAALAGNESGFDVSASPIDISSLNTTTYNRICLRATLTDVSGTPFLNDWTVTWGTGGASPTFTLSTYHWYEDNNLANPTAIWGTPDIAQSTSITTVPATNDPPESVEELRLRVAYTVSGTLSASSSYFKLQYKATTDGDCTSASGWTDVGAGGGGSIWRYAASDVSNGANITRIFGTSDVDGQYVKAINPGVANTNGAVNNQDIEYDFHIEHNGATEAITYSFRVVETSSDGSTTTAFGGYTVCPTLETRPGTSNLLRHGNHFVDQVKKGFFWVN